MVWYSCYVLHQRCNPEDDFCVPLTYNCDSGNGGDGHGGGDWNSPLECPHDQVGLYITNVINRCTYVVVFDYIHTNSKNALTVFN